MAPSKAPNSLKERKFSRTVFSRVRLLDDIHRNLARKRDRARIAPNLQILFTQIEAFANAFLNQVYGDALFLRRNYLLSALDGRRVRDGLAVFLSDLRLG